MISLVFIIEKIKDPGLKKIAVKGYERGLKKSQEIQMKHEIEDQLGNERFSL